MLMVKVKFYALAVVGVAGQAQQLVHALLLLLRVEQVARALLTGAARAANAVGVVLVFLGHVVVDDGIHIGNVNAARCHIGGDQHVDFPGLEPRHDAVALSLGQVAVQAVHIEVQPGKLVGQHPRVVLGVAEDHDPLVALVNDDLRGVGQLVTARGQQLVLGNFRAGILDGLDADLGGVVLVEPTDVQHLAADGRREHRQALAVLHQVDDVLDVLVKAHVQHLVGLVQHDGFDVGDINGVVAVVVHQAARRGNDDLAAGFELALLLVHARAAIDADDFDVRQKLRQILQVLGDLLGQLPRGA